MKNLKIATLLICSLFFVQAKAQNDIKINVLNALFYEVSASYEYGINENLSIGAFGGYVYGFPDVSNYTKYGYFGPELRYYIAPKRGLDRFYVGVYSRFKTGYTSADVEESGVDLVTNQYVYNYYSTDLDYNKLAVGLTMGGKWVTESGFIFGVQGGLGRNLFAQYNDDDIYMLDPNDFQAGTFYSNYDRANIDSEYWDFRIAFNIGWRLGK